MFMLDPHEVEGVTLAARVRRYGWTRGSDVMCRCGRGAGRRDLGERIHSATIRQLYRHQHAATPPKRGRGLNSPPSAKLEITGDATLGPWIALASRKLRFDSANWENGEPATFFKGKDRNPAARSCTAATRQRR